MSHEISEDLRLIDEEGQDPADPTGHRNGRPESDWPNSKGSFTFFTAAGDDFST